MLADFIVHTLPSQEALAHNEIQRAGFDVLWLATREERRNRHGRFTNVVSLFPSYIFVTFDRDEQEWTVIPRLRGVHRILGSSPTNPTAMRDGSLASLRRRFDAGEYTVTRAVRAVRVGDVLRVSLGPFGGKVGVCTLSRAQRIKVLLSCFGTRHEVEMRSDAVERCVA